MHRRIVVLREHESLRSSWMERSFAPARSKVEESIQVHGVKFDETYPPTEFIGRSTFILERPGALGFDYRAFGDLKTTPSYSLRAEFEDEDAIERLKRDRSQEVVGVFADPTISIFPQPYCGAAPIGDERDVFVKLGGRTLKKIGLTGRRVRVAVVDTGIDGRIVPVSGGWSPVPNYVPGSALTGHGTMVAWDVKITAPDARILDYALLQSTGETWTAFLSDAILAFANLMDFIQREPGSLVVNNSWGMFDRSEDAPIGSPENYSSNPDHPFNQIVGTLVSTGADVLFAAGNCGKECPDSRCGTQDVGPGSSIHGANSHPDVLTVAAVTVTDRRLGYSSQGPGGLTRRKPDIAAFSHFRGSGVYPVDGGTSAASPVAAGVVAALRQRYSPEKLSPAGLKGLLQRTCRDIQGDGWDFDLGYGVIHAGNSVKALGIPTTTTKEKRKKKGKKRR